MSSTLTPIALAVCFAGVSLSASALAHAREEGHPGDINKRSQDRRSKDWRSNDWQWKRRRQQRGKNDVTVQLGPRPYYLVDDMEDGRLKDKLMSCEDGPFRQSDFSIGHRGAPLQFPEHTVESYTAASRMGAGILECDVTFTNDRQLVCRHSQCDLHTTTNILAIPELAQKCTQPFSPADPATGKPASAL